jgi:hypothetical protein
MRVAVACERVKTGGGPSQAEVVGCLLGPLLVGWLVALLFVLGLRGRRAAGEDVTIILPLPVCEACRPGLEEPSALSQALRQIPDYAALLDHYPKARVAPRG